MTLTEIVRQLTQYELHSIIHDVDYTQRGREVRILTDSTHREVLEACLLERDRRFQERGRQ